MLTRETFEVYESALAERAEAADTSEGVEAARRSQIAATAVIESILWDQSDANALGTMVHLRRPEADPRRARQQRLVFASMQTDGSETPSPWQLLEMLCDDDVAYDLSIRVP